MADKSDRHVQTLPLAKFALQQIERLGLPADPQSFELWYTYAAGHNKILNNSVDAALNSAAGLTEEEFYRLCELHVSSRRSAQRLNAIASGLSGEITQVIDTIENAVAYSESYDRHLGEGLQTIERTPTYQTLKPLVEALAKATKEMEGQTRTLEMQLKESKVRTVDLQKDVELLRLETLTDPLTLIGNRQRFDESLLTMTMSATASN